MPFESLRASGSPLRHLGRFTLHRRLGAGAMGTVYAARDDEWSTDVALKVLAGRSTEALEAFKHEFRLCQSLAHPNIAALGELFVEDEVWFFTMELVHGVPFLDALDGAPRTDLPRGAADLDAPSCSSAGQFESARSHAGQPGSARSHARANRLRSLLAQLVHGLQYLHSAGKVHRDVNSGNVLVTPEDLVVLIDFGIVVERDYTDSSSAGAPLSISPEHARGAPATPASDFYAVGVLLYQALTGRDPYEGTVHDILVAKRTPRTHTNAEFPLDAPSDLVALCIELLSPDPQARPKAADILAALGDVEDFSAAGTLAGGEAPFVGRRRELDALCTGFSTVLHERERAQRESPVSDRPPSSSSARRHGGAPEIFVVESDSGMGKSRLLGEFARTLLGRRSTPLVLTGRCLPDESVPFNAFEGVFSQVAAWLARLPAADARKLLPPGCWHLATSFPSFTPLFDALEVEGRLPSSFPPPADEAEGATGAISARSTYPSIDPSERRRQIFTLARELLSRIALQVPIVILLDDFGGADADSYGLLASLVRRPTPVGLFFVLAVQERPSPGAFANITPSILPLGVLTPADCHEFLLAHEAGRAAPPAGRTEETSDAEDLAGLVDASGGNPFLLEELLRSRKLRASGSRVRDKKLPDRAAEALHGADGYSESLSDATSEMRVREALLERVGELDEESRQMLEALCVSSRPLPHALLARVAAVAPSIAFKHVKRLKRARLVKLPVDDRSYESAPLVPNASPVASERRGSLPESVLPSRFGGALDAVPPVQLGVAPAAAPPARFGVAPAAVPPARFGGPPEAVPPARFGGPPEAVPPEPEASGPHNLFQVLARSTMPTEGRGREARGADFIEPYHRKVRSAVLSTLSATDRRRYHARLAEALLEHSPGDEAALFLHFAGADDHAQARPFALLAARRAERALAFEKAASAYRYLLERADADGRPSGDFVVSLAKMLIAAGRAREGADAYLRAAKEHGGRRGRVYRRRAAEALLRAGYLSEGERHLHISLAELHLPVITDSIFKIPKLIYARTRVHLRGYAYTLRDEATIPASDLERIDTVWAAACGLLMSDHVRGFVYHALNVRLALDSGDAKRVVRALGMEAIFLSTQGPAEIAKADALLSDADRIAKERGDSYSVAWVLTARCMSSAVRGRWDEVLRHSTPALRALAATNTSAHWEVGTVRQNELWALGYFGEYARLEEAVERARLAATATGDKFAETALRVGIPNLVHLFRDDPETAVSDAQSAIREWSAGPDGTPSAGGFHLQHLQCEWSALFAAVYRHDMGASKHHLQLAEAGYAGSGLDRVRPSRVIMEEMRARVGLALGDRLAVLKAVAALRTEGVPWTTGMADAFAFALAVAESPDGKWVQDASMVLTSLSSARLGGYRDAVTRMVALATRDVAGHERLCGALTAQRVTKPDHLLFAMLPVPTMCP